MGKIWVVALTVLTLVGCSKVDNHNIVMTFYKDGELKQAELKPDDQLIVETTQNGETTHKDKFDRWQHVKLDKIILEEDDGNMLVKDGSTGEYVWKIKDLNGNDVSEESLYSMQNNAGYINEIESNKVPIQYQDFGQNRLYGDEKYSDTHPKQYPFKLVDYKIPPIPKEFGEQYKVDNPFFISFNSLDEGWDKYQRLTQNKVIAYGREIQKAFFSDKYQVNFSYSKDFETDILYRYNKVEIETNSYWVGKNVGSFKPFYYEAKPCAELQMLRSDHFKEDVKKYVEKTFRPIWLAHFEKNDAFTSERTFVESARITMVPLSRKVWAIFVGSQKGKVDPFIDEIWTFSVVQFDSKKPILRAFGQKTQTDTETWSTLGQMKIDADWADPEYMMELYGVFDANCDGYKDFVFRWDGMGSGDEDSFRILVVSLIDKGFCEIVPETPLRDFYGLDGEKPLFQLGEFGEGQMYTTFFQEPLMLLRWNKWLFKVAQSRSDGNFYLVSYKYHKNIEELINRIYEKNITYLYLGDFELIGQTKHAQEAFLETTAWCTQEQKDIVKVLLSKNHTMFVFKPEELLSELKSHNPR